MGADTPPPGENTWDMLQSFRAQLPGIISQLNNSMPQTGMSSLRTLNQMQNPGSHDVLGLNALNLQQEQRLMPAEQQLYSQIARQVAPQQAALMEQYSPAYRGANSAINAINLNGLSPGEASAVERSLNQTNTSTGNLGLINPTNTITNALNFGGAFNNKVGLMNQAVGAASGAMGGFNPANASFGQGQFVNTNYNSSQPTSQSVFGFGQGLLGNMTSSNNTLLGSQTSIANNQSIPSYLGAVCCFIFLEAYHGKLPKCVRKGRDKYYGVNAYIASGYRRMAKWLVPLMQCNPYIRNLVWIVMVAPITEHLEHPRKGWRKSLTHFWLRYWAITGKNHWDSEYAELMYV